MENNEFDGYGYGEIGPPRSDVVYSTLQVCKVLGINRERLRDWMVQGVIRPTLTIPDPRGTKSLFTESDIVGIALFKKLVDQGYKRDLLASMFENVIGVAGAFFHIASYYIFRVEEREDGGNEIYSDLIMSGDGKLPIELAVDSLKIGNGTPLDAKDWEDLHIYNLMSIQHKVRRAIKENL